MVSRKTCFRSHFISRDFGGTRQAQSSQELGQGERVIFLFQNVGFHPHLGGKYFKTVPALYVSLFLLDLVHKIHQSIISSMPFCVGTVTSSQANLHRSYLYINLNSREMPILLYHKSFFPLKLNQQILGMAGVSEMPMCFSLLYLFFLFCSSCSPKQASPERDVSVQESRKRNRNSKGWGQGRAEEGEELILIVQVLNFQQCQSHVNVRSCVCELKQPHGAVT